MGNNIREYEIFAYIWPNLLGNTRNKNLGYMYAIGREDTMDRVIKSMNDRNITESLIVT